MANPSTAEQSFGPFRLKFIGLCIQPFNICKELFMVNRNVAIKILPEDGISEKNSHFFSFWDVHGI
jgi:hypothetical protein